MHNSDYRYLEGFGNILKSEAIPNILPDINSPKIEGLYTEQLSGSPFVEERHNNKRSWLYRKNPSVKTTNYECLHTISLLDLVISTKETIDPMPTRWLPIELEKFSEIFDYDYNGLFDNTFKDWLHGLVKLCGSGSPSTGAGLNIYIYYATNNMEDSFVNTDGDLLIVPQQGILDIKTEFGRLSVKPNEIVVIPRGIVFKIDKGNKSNLRGYVLEVFDGHFELPNLGPIGSNGLAYPRHFQIPTASFDDYHFSDNSDNSDDSDDSDKIIHTTITKFQNHFFLTKKDHTPYDVVAWHGNYYPFKYDLTKFCGLNTVTYDHPDPSIFTVLTCKSKSGKVCADLAVFKPRWSVAENTFRPPYFHRNYMTEFMGLINGTYDAKSEGFLPGGASLHHCMIPHGPDVDSYKKGIECDDKPVKIDCGLAFMFETSYMLKLVKNVGINNLVDKNYTKCWNSFT